MKWTCSAVRRRLPEYHDGELTIDQRVAIQSHLSACPACAAEGQQLHMVTTVLRAAAVEHAYAVDSHDLDGLAAGVVSRLRAEREESFSYAVGRIFEDLHLVWAALSATAATCVCLALTVGIFYFSRPVDDSLGNLMDAYSAASWSSFSLEVARLAQSDSNPMQVDDRVDPQIVLPRQDLERIAAVPEMTSDEEIMVDATIDTKGRVASLQLMNLDEQTAQHADWKTVGEVLDSVAQARFEPARLGGERVAVKMFWYLTHTTVRAKVRGEARRGPRANTHAVAMSVV